MEQPPRFVAPGEIHLVCKLKKAIYGLKQSPRAWFDKFNQAVFAAGFRRNQADHSVFVPHSSSGIVILIVYVNDILLSGSDITSIAETMKYLQQQFVTKVLGQLRYFLGIEVARGKRG